MSTTIRNGNLFCSKCGTEHKLNMPIAISEITKKTELFTELHKDCLQTWREPKLDQENKTIQEKASWWVANGSHGMSSKTMWACFMGQTDFRVNYPHDPDDFSRAYKLLEAVPEWKDQKYMNRLKPLCKQWENLVNNWDALTQMYEKNVSENWKNSKEIGMYELMKRCTS